MAETDTDGNEAGLEDRVERLETGQSKILGKLDELLGAGSKTHQAAEKHQAERLDRPSSIEEQVRMELARKEREAAEQAAKDQEKSERQTLAERLAKLEEAPPVQPQPRRQRVMWGKR